MGAKQTAVEWFIDQIKEYDFADINDKENWIIKIPASVLTEKEEQAKAMEKEQMIQFTNNYLRQIYEVGEMTVEYFYNETYGGSK
jgi:hypothetical protein